MGRVLILELTGQVVPTKLKRLTNATAESPSIRAVLERGETLETEPDPTSPRIQRVHAAFANSEFGPFQNQKILWLPSLGFPSCPLNKTFAPRLASNVQCAFVSEP